MTIYYADLHVHTAASPDGRSSLEDLTAAAAAAGLQALAVTDHDRCTPVPAAMNGILLIPGCELSTRAGHITGLFLERPVDLAALGHLPEPEAAVAAIRAAGGLAVLAHPFQRPDRREADFAFPLDAVEAVNARACFKHPAANDQAAAFAAARGLPAVGGSDAHSAGEVGNGLTILEADALTLPALRAALAAGRCRAQLRKNTPHLRKGLSQWTKARRQGGARRLCRAAAYVGYCALLDLFRR